MRYKNVMLFHKNITFSTFSAWETRKIHIEALNDSKSVGLCIYNVFIVSTVGMSISQLLQQNKVDEIYIASSACILFATTGTLLAIFLPKVSSAGLILLLNIQHKYLKISVPIHCI